jgi:hypothetical protein
MRDVQEAIIQTRDTTTTMTVAAATVVCRYHCRCHMSPWAVGSLETYSGH